MRIWHMTADAGREPLRVAPGESARLVVGSAPIEPGQSVWITYDVIHPGGSVERGMLSLPWHHNDREASYWAAPFGPFECGDRVTYQVHGAAGPQRLELPPFRFTVGPRLFLALLWHQHQPAYVDLSQPPQGSVAQPWVRLHALRGYYAMPALGARFPDLRVTYNLTPVLLWQIERYVQHGATDPALDLTRKPAERLTPGEQEAIFETFFDAGWRDQILPFPRYLELYERRREQQPFSTQDIRDLQMWHNLAWFAPEFQQGEVALPGGQTASVRRFVQQEGSFGEADIEEMLAEQYKVLGAIVPLHRELQDRGLIEVSTSPFAHPILPLIYDTDSATIDRPGACKPPRFSHPEDAEAQVARAVEFYRERFGRPPRGMWPSEGAVSAEIMPILSRAGFEWLASDQGVLQRSGRFGYDAANPDVLGRPYQVQSEGRALALFFRDAGLSNLISFRYHQAYGDMEAAAGDWLRTIVDDFAGRICGLEDRILTIALDGENTWSAYGLRAPAFLQALYRRLTESAEIETVTFSQYLHGDAERRIAEHPAAAQELVDRLYTGSWIDEIGSAPGVDLGTWVGEPDENRAWGLLAEAHEALAEASITPTSHPRAYEALYLAEGSDWFWWLGSDHAGPYNARFEALFRLHLSNAYRFAGLEPPATLAQPLIPWSLLWTLAARPELIRPQEQMTVQANCRGTVLWRALPGDEQGEAVLLPVNGFGGILARYEATLGPFGPTIREVQVSFRCHEGQAGELAPCAVEEMMAHGPD
ncbi:MAG TPA: glycoside hydrolase family 57 protein [Anaerolineae bacterium]|nr:glycoside hydrolase family 57 protein [Anaerolineae bacterium]HOQ97612.1 glycoside hydrolase family 57 protein [Anaerolineae bacterium]HPL26554.1 glycoside hydrolase family 57 protein [Anaerolineae bacterium]HPL26555.1 glycoside hydrolase family 57 protein [Anaerolineae bacterium]